MTNIRIAPSNKIMDLHLLGGYQRPNGEGGDLYWTGLCVKVQGEMLSETWTPAKGQVGITGGGTATIRNSDGFSSNGSSVWVSGGKEMDVTIEGSKVPFDGGTATVTGRQVTVKIDGTKMIIEKGGKVTIEIKEERKMMSFEGYTVTIEDGQVFLSD